ncbi:IS3 family transposase [Geobacter sulfurreducens]|uniref:IS3 family transposase n=1 Tax=Geobacter sulfurreducens TaxID=35554 RepID=UPI0025722867|nr:IS3 family transposase [Geobacter sulfurreducens]
MVSRRKRFTREFKVETVKLTVDGDSSVAQIATDLGIHPNTLYKWIRQYSDKPDDAFPGTGHLSSEAETIRQLKRENERLKMERDIFKKSHGHLFQRPEMIFRFMHDHQAEFPVAVMCSVFQVSRSGYYAWSTRPESQRSKETRELCQEIAQIHRDSKGIYGSPKVHKELRRRGKRHGKNRIARLMRKDGLYAKTKRKFKVTTDSRHSQPVANNLLNREFNPARPNQVWASDITYIWTAEGWLYLAVVIDLYSRTIVGWSMAERMTRQLVMAALTLAVKRRNPPRGVLHHSDRGAQYASEDYQVLLAKHGMICSMSRTGNCWDNAPVESFFGILKRELVFHSRYHSRAQARQSIFDYIERFYNRRRIHASLGYLTPSEFEELNLAA